MPRVRLVHWKVSEAAELLAALRRAGHLAEYDENLTSNGFRGIREWPPDAFVIDLSRLPSHGREVATFFRGRKATRHIPIVFVGGAPEKVEAIRKLLPDAVYATRGRLRSALRAGRVGRRRVTLSHVSNAPSSNWTCGFPASSSPTIFFRRRAPQARQMAHSPYHLIQPTPFVQELVVPVLPSRPPTALVFASEP